MKKSLVIFASFLGLAISVPTFAHPPSPEKRAEKLFERFDTNQDGSITQDEVTAKQNEHFTAIDADGNGELTKEEMKTAHGKRREAKRAKVQEKIDSGELPADALERKHQFRKPGKHGRRGGKRFERLDTDGNGTISREEFTARLQVFDRFDCENDGIISRDDVLQGPCHKRK